MRFQPVKCNMMQLTNKRSSKIQANYTLEGTVLENVESIKYLGVTITNDLKWNTHISNVCTKANITLGFLRRNLYSCPPDVKEAAYKQVGFFKKKPMKMSAAVCYKSVVDSALVRD